MTKELFTASKSVIEWLLEQENPSVRYFTLRDILDKKETDSEVREAKAHIPSSKVVAKILSKQKAEGYWEQRHKPYLPKYKATYWQLMALAQLGMDNTKPETQQTCEFVLSLQLSEGGFSSHTLKAALEEYDWMRSKVALKEKPAPDSNEWAQSRVTEYQMSCLTGN